MNTSISYAVAWMTHHDVPMLYPTFEEAAAYCDEDEPPIPLYTKPQPAKPEAVRLRDELRERAEFEEWVRSPIGPSENLLEFGWRTWKAALAATSKQQVDCGNCHEGKSDMDHVCRDCEGTGKQQVGEVQGERTPADYAIEHAGYLVTAASQLLEARNELDALVMRRDEDDGVDEDEMQAAHEGVSDASSCLRIAIYEFEKRRDRALAARQPGVPVGLAGPFLSDVVTAAGLLSTGGQSKALASRISNEAFRLLAMLHAAPPAQQHGEPVAWMTHHDEPMLFPTAAEAAAYCEDDEQPVPLFRSPAQAVDLEQFRKLADYWDRITQDKDIKFKDRELIAMYDKGLNKCSRELRALIDGKAVQCDR